MYVFVNEILNSIDMAFIQFKFDFEVYSVTRAIQVTLVEHELLTLPEHLISSSSSWGSSCSILVSVWCFFFAKVLSVLRFTDSDDSLASTKSFHRSRVMAFDLNMCKIMFHWFHDIVSSLTGLIMLNFMVSDFYRPRVMSVHCAYI